MITGLKNQTAHGRFWNTNRAAVGCRRRGLGNEEPEKYHGTQVAIFLRHLIRNDALFWPWQGYPTLAEKWLPHDRFVRSQIGWYQAQTALKIDCMGCTLRSIMFSYHFEGNMWLDRSVHGVHTSINHVFTSF